MRDYFVIGFLCGLMVPILLVVVFYLAKFTYLSPLEFIQQAFILKVHFKIIAVGVFFADLGLFFLFDRFKKQNAAKGVVLSVFLYFFLMVIAMVF